VRRHRCPTRLSREGIRPDFVVIGEPTKMQVYRGHKGRLEMEVVSAGKSAHAASNHGRQRDLQDAAGDRRHQQDGATLGDPRVPGPRQDHRQRHEASAPRRSTPCPTSARIFIDRRVTFGESRRRAPSSRSRRCSAPTQGRHHHRELKYDEPSYTGFVFPVDKYFPAWALDEDIRSCRLASPRVAPSACPLRRPASGASAPTASTGRGKAGIPIDRLRPRRRDLPPTPTKIRGTGRCCEATEFYALLPGTRRDLRRHLCLSLPPPLPSPTI
jgi:hypothetical protein